MTAPCIPPDYAADWPAAVQRLYLLAREHPSLQGVPSHVLEAMRDLLLAAPSAPAKPSGCIHDPEQPKGCYRVRCQLGNRCAETIQWPQERRVGRREDMSPTGLLEVGLDSDNDVWVRVSAGRDEHDWQSAGVEFCNGGGGGGRSARTRVALINLMSAIEADNAEYPHKAFPPPSRESGKAP